VADVVTTKLFRNGGSLAVRIPAGWLAEGEITLSREERTGRIYISQDTQFDPNEFFRFVRARGFVPDDALLNLSQRDDSTRPTILD
jgi:hypothetical protein